MRRWAKTVLGDRDRSEPALLALVCVLVVLTWISAGAEAWLFAAAVPPLLMMLAARRPSDDCAGRWPLLAAAGAFAGALALWLAADASAAAGPRMVLEVLLAAAVAAAATALALAAHRALDRVGAHTFAGPVAAGALAWAGAVARWAELRTIARHADLAVLDLVLRHDVAAILWSLAGTVLALHLVYGLVAAGLIRWTPGIWRAVAVLAVAMALVSHALFVAGTVAATTASGRPAIGIGVHAEDVARVPEGFDAVHLEVWWGRVQPAPGVWDWSYYDAQMAAAGARGLDVFLLAGLAPPAWAIEAHPDSVMVDQDGRPFHWVDTAPGAAKDRIHDLSYADPGVNALREEFVRRVAARYGDRDGVVGLAVMNEPAYPGEFNLFRLGSYDDATVAAFRAHLASAYDGPAGVNRALGTNVTRMADLDPPRSLDGALGEAWQAFRGDTIVHLVERLMQAAREGTDRPVTVKIMAHYLARFATPQTALTGRVVHQLVAMSDVVAVDLYPVSHADLERTLGYLRGLAGPKAIWVAEFNHAPGPNLPTMGARTYGALALLGRYAERVFLFTAEDHFLYGLDRYAASPSLTAVRLYRTSALSGDFLGLQAELVADELAAVANVYHVYATGSAFAGVPVVPWPVLVLLVLPLPQVRRVATRHVKLGRTVAAGCLWVAIWLPGAMGAG